MNHSSLLHHQGEILGLLRELPKKAENHRVFVFIVDGLGRANLNLPFLQRSTLTTVFPSSTPTFFYSFHSLLSPAEHGFLEWFYRFKEEIITIPPWKTLDGKALELGRDVSAEEVFPFPTLSELLHKRGILHTYYTPYGDTFDRAASPYAKLRKIRTLSDIFPLDEEADFHFIYWPHVDRILHERYKDEAYETEISLVELVAKKIWKIIPENSEFFLFSDHGMVKCNTIFPLPIIAGEVPVGGGRVAFYRNLSVEEVEREINLKGIAADVLPLDEIYKGFRISKRAREYGEVVVIAPPNVAFSYPFEGKKQMVGFHGGLTEEEMLIHVWRGKK